MQNNISEEYDIKAQQETLVLGGTGKTGRRIVERLTTLGVPVKVGSRSSATPFDWDDRTTWESVLKNISAIYIAFVPDLAVPGAPDAIQTLTELAVRNGVKKLVLLSGRGEEEAERCEQIVRESGAEWTILRASWFNQNFSESFIKGPVLGGVVALPSGDIPEPFIDVGDIADVAVAALTEGGHAGQLYELTGPRLLTFAEAVEIIGEASGREIQFQPISHEEFAAGLEADQVPSDYIALLRYLFEAVLDGRNSSLGDGVQRALGREPRDFSAYAKKTAEEGQWAV